VAQAGDCDDIDPATNPGADERCNERDDNCDGQIDEALTFTEWYPDEDEDGYGANVVPVVSCEQPPGFVGTADDCADDDASIHPDQSDDDCDGQDDDCDGEADEDSSILSWYLDDDDDGHGLDTLSVSSCTAPDGYADAGGDCDDEDFSVHPGAYDDTCDGVNNDCDDALDEDAVGFEWFYDGDSDGYGLVTESLLACLAPELYTDRAGDCNDENSSIHPDAVDDNCDEVDDNCDGVSDDGSEFFALYFDGDGDRHGVTDEMIMSCSERESYVELAGDCDDENPAIHPGIVDDNCDEVDDNCDGVSDDDSEFFALYFDGDGDGYGADTAMVMSCSLLESHTDRAGDCDDTKSEIHPGMEDADCDGVDENCNGEPDDGSEFFGLYFDGDGDGYGADTAMVMSCSLLESHTDRAGDCDDTKSEIHPDASDATCDGVDDNCDGDPDEGAEYLVWYLDDDGDGYGTEGSTTLDCSKPEGYSSVLGDCDDMDPSIHPAADETLGGQDDDCSGSVDDLALSDATMRISGGLDDDGFGYALASGKDLTGDGVPDIVVGTLGSETVTLFSGTLGSGEFTAADAVITLTGGSSSLGFGTSVDLVTDYDGDGHSDLVVGAPDSPLGGRSGKGEARILLGPFDGDEEGTADDILSDTSLSFFGSTVIDAGHVSGIETSAVAGSYSDPTTGQDGVIIFDNGPLSTDTTWQHEVVGNGDVDGFGSAMVVADLNGDGIDDLIVGAPTAESVEGEVFEAGAVHVFYGPLASYLTTAEGSLVLLGQEVGERLGAALASNGDWDGDGHVDLLVGSPGRDLEDGAAFVVLSDGLGDGGNIDEVASARLSGPEGALGYAVALNGDVDGDGLADALIGAPKHSEVAFKAGSVALFLSDGVGVFDSADALVRGSVSNQTAGYVVDYSWDAGESTNSGLVFGAWGAGLDEDDSSTEGVGAVFLVESVFSAAD
jgi:hypothetical protein